MPRVRIQQSIIQKVRKSLQAISQDGKVVFINAIQASLELYKVMIPLLILTRFLEETGIIILLGNLLKPLMGIVDLPGNMGLVWATSLIVGTYGAILVLVTFIASTPLTAAQITILLTMCLIAHSLPVEAVIARKAGLRIGFHVLLRIGGGIVYGLIFRYFYQVSNTFQESAKILVPISIPDTTLIEWIKAQIQNLASIFLIILGVMALLRLLEALGVVSLLVKILGPVLRLIGIGERAVPVTMVGILLGLSYGGGLIIQEAKSGKIPQQDMFFSLALMSILHSIIEDTVTMIMFGAELIGLLWGRLLFTFIALFLLMKLIHSVPERIFHRYFFSPVRLVN